MELIESERQDLCMSFLNLEGMKLAESLGAEVVKIAFVMELAGLKGRERLAGYDVESVITYEGK